MRSRLINCVPAILLLVLAPPAYSAAPDEVPLQGVLTDQNGVPLNGGVDVLFSIYDVQSGGSALWDETQALAVENGLFTAYLGRVTPLDLTLFRDNGALWLGIQVGADPEMSRIPLGSTPFAAYAEYTGALPAGIPDGMIAAFDTACPSGWTRVAAFDGRVLRGAASYGGTGGGDTHLHQANPPSTGTSTDGAHSHNTTLTTRGIGHNHSVDPPATSSANQSNNHQHGYDSGTSGAQMTAGISQNHNHSVNIGSFTSGNTNPTDQYANGTGSAGGHNHTVDIAGFDSGSGDSWPPYIEVVYCKKDPTRRTVSLNRENRFLKTKVRTLEARLSRLEELLQERER